MATSAVLEYYSKNVDNLESTAEDESQKAKNIANKMKELESLSMLTMLNEVLQCFHHTSKAHQETALNFRNKSCASIC